VGAPAAFFHHGHAGFRVDDGEVELERLCEGAAATALSLRVPARTVLRRVVR
jgi:hypothetical protein